MCRLGRLTALASDEVGATRREWAWMLCLSWVVCLIVAVTTEIYTLSLHDALPISARPAPTAAAPVRWAGRATVRGRAPGGADRKSTRLNSSHVKISYAVFCLKKKKQMVIAGSIHKTNQPWKSNVQTDRCARLRKT